MADLKTKKTKTTVDTYIATLGEPRRSDCRVLCDIMRSITKDEGAMWGPSIAGFGEHHYKYKSGREGDWFLAGFSSRKQALTIYLMGGFDSREKLLAKLGKHKTGKACLYIKSLDDIDLPTLKKLISESVKAMRASSEGC